MSTSASMTMPTAPLGGDAETTASPVKRNATLAIGGIACAGDARSI